MPAPRKQLISLLDTSWYHCVSRCVRRARLCGQDPYDGKDYSHRRQWVVDRMNKLTKAFAVEVAAYSIMSNHTHLALRIDAPLTAGWSCEKVVEQWHLIYKGNMLSQRLLKGEQLDSAEIKILQQKAEIWRERLCSISWFMGALNEHIARLANAEDKVTGKYWEARFKSHALLDDQAILACMTYPIAAR